MADHESGSLAAARHAIAQQRAALGRGSAVRHGFQRSAQHASRLVGTPWAFLAALAIVVAWALCGALFKFSDTWQLVINTGTTIITFLMVFLIQNTQYRDAKAIHLKLDELIRAKHGARNTMVDLEHCTDEELDLIEAEFKRIRTRAEHSEGHHRNANHANHHAEAESPADSASRA